MLSPSSKTVAPVAITLRHTLFELLQLTPLSGA